MLQDVSLVSMLEDTMTPVGQTVSERVSALRELRIMDSPPEPEYDEMVELAAAIFEVPIGLLSFIDDQRQWYKASVGVQEHETPIELTLCQYTLREDDLLVIEDTRDNPLVSNHPSVLGTPSLRFYAGVSIKTSQGCPIGTICVADTVPRRISSMQSKALRILARQVNARIELREQSFRLQEALDISEKDRKELVAAESLFRAFVDSGPFLSYLKDANGKIVFHNRSLTRTLGLDLPDILGKTDFDLWPAPYAEKLREHELEVMRSGVLHTVQDISVDAEGNDRFWRSYKFPCAAADGSMLLGGISVDITEDLRRQAQVESYQQELEQANERLQELATTDPLTGLPNRRAFDDRMAVEFAVSRRSRSPLSVLLLDVDNFKQHNDRFGHDAGDTTLCQVATLLQLAARKSDFVARYGGEEFILILPDTTDAQAQEIGERILGTLRSAIWPLASVTASAGAATTTPATVEASRLVTLADEALYVAKRAGKDRVVSYSSYFQQLMSTLA